MKVLGMHRMDAQKLLAIIIGSCGLSGFVATSLLLGQNRVTKVRFRAMKMFQDFFQLQTTCASLNVSPVIWSSTMLN